MIVGRTVATPIPIPTRAINNNVKFGEKIQSNELTVTRAIPLVKSVRKPIFRLRLPNTGIRTEKVSVYRVIESTDWVREME